MTFENDKGIFQINNVNECVTTTWSLTECSLKYCSPQYLGHAAMTSLATKMRAQMKEFGERPWRNSWINLIAGKFRFHCRLQIPTGATNDITADWQTNPGLPCYSSVWYSWYCMLPQEPSTNRKFRNYNFYRQLKGVLLPPRTLPLHCYLLFAKLPPRTHVCCHLS